MTDDPIIPREDAQPFGAEIIDLDGIRVQWGLPKPSTASPCQHDHLTYSSQERRVWCQDCERSIDNFDAFMVFVRNFGRMMRDARTKMQKADDAMKATIHRRATKALDKAWSGHLSAVGCPHCHKGILPEDFADGITSASSREYELARREKQGHPRPLGSSRGPQPR